MGRYSSGKITTEASQRLELSYLLKNGFIQKEMELIGTLSWNNANQIVLITEFTSEKKYIRLIYQHINSLSGEVSVMDYFIKLDSIPSNLGKGMVLYFICPLTGRRSRILYKCYGSQYFKCKQAYKNKIYYSCQILSKSTYDNERYFAAVRKLDKLYPKIKKQHYKGMQTRLIKRVKLLEIKRDYYDYKSLISLTSAIK